MFVTRDVCKMSSNKRYCLFYTGLCVVLSMAPHGLYAQQYFQYSDKAQLQESFGYAPASGNPWAPPSQTAPVYEPSAPAYDYPPPAASQESAASPFAPPAGEHYISEQELQQLERVTDKSALWIDPDSKGGDVLSGFDNTGSYPSSQQGDAWGKLDTRGLVGNSGYRGPPATQYAPYSFGVPGVYPPTSGYSQAYQPNRYYNLTTPRLDPRAMDSINSGSYMNNSIAPFLY